MLIVLESIHGALLSLVDMQIGKEVGRQNMYMVLNIWLGKITFMSSFSRCVCNVDLVNSDNNGLLHERNIYR